MNLHFMNNVIILTIISFFIVLWCLVLTIWLYKTAKHYQKLVEGVEKGNLKEILEKILGRLETDKKGIEELGKKIVELKEDGQKHIQKIKLVRFNPFGDTGGDQSFILGLLDEDKNGVILTSLHSRTQTRWYAKPIKEGKGEDYELSGEEEKVVQ